MVSTSMVSKSKSVSTLAPKPSTGAAWSPTQAPNRSRTKEDYPMKNFVQPGDVVTTSPASAVTSGQGVRLTTVWCLGLSRCRPPISRSSPSAYSTWPRPAAFEQRRQWANVHCDNTGLKATGRLHQLRIGVALAAPPTPTDCPGPPSWGLVALTVVPMPRPAQSPGRVCLRSRARRCDPGTPAYGGMVHAASPPRWRIPTELTSRAIPHAWMTRTRKPDPARPQPHCGPVHGAAGCQSP